MVAFHSSAQSAGDMRTAQGSIQLPRRIWVPLRGAPRSHAEPASGHPVDQPNQPDPQVLGWHTDAMKFVSSDPVLAVHDLDRTSLWLTRVLGCERSDPDPGNWTFCRAGTVTFMLGRCPEVVPASELGDHSYLAYLSVENVGDYHARDFRASRSPESPDG